MMYKEEGTAIPSDNLKALMKIIVTRKFVGGNDGASASEQSTGAAKQGQPFEYSTAPASPLRG
jgi:hypothetical protein